MVYTKVKPQGAAADPVVVTAPDPLPAPTSEEKKADQMGMEVMRKYYQAQEKVSVRVREDTWVQTNGYTFIIKKNERVDVPKGIAEILESAGKI